MRLTRGTVRRADQAGDSVTLAFADNRLLVPLFGAHNRNLARIEQRLDVAINARGNEVTIAGAAGEVEVARAALESLYARLERNEEIEPGDVDAMVRLIDHDPVEAEAATGLTIRTRRKPVSPRTPLQADYIRAMQANDLVFGVGPAGTGKTYLAVAMAVQMLSTGDIDRIILSRPAVEAGERLGFLPGDMKEKVDPYLQPLYDGLRETLREGELEKRMESGAIEVAPLAFMRGRTLKNSFVILDEAQNTTAVQMKMFLTRLGENSRMVVTGDLSQVDLPGNQRSGLAEALEVLRDVESISTVRFTDKDVVRHKLVADIVKAYDAYSAYNSGRRIDGEQG
ncbi:phosphate starvation-inducible protein PhoH [Alphaproteobacteria bacterium HT1-32]|nr:phosphate starvation-inducible protein PhoH [Alphaproteobacteria bacterium HT1-32]|tara:strand:- start:1505 stop:2524 length:1020 start_codon:yes stop_codon:yes gene_type:complete